MFLFQNTFSHNEEEKACGRIYGSIYGGIMVRYVTVCVVVFWWGILCSSIMVLYMLVVFTLYLEGKNVWLMFDSHILSYIRPFPRRSCSICVTVSGMIVLMVEDMIVLVGWCSSIWCNSICNQGKTPRDQCQKAPRSPPRPTPNMSRQDPLGKGNP